MPDELFENGHRRLRVIEIGVVADDRQLHELCLAFSSILNGEVDIRQLTAAPLPATINSYDGADLPRSVHGEFLAEIESTRNAVHARL